MASNNAEQKPHLGYIGMGAMGSRMATRLAEAGYPLTVYDRTREKAEPLAHDGATIVNSPRELAERSQVIFSSLTADDAVRAVLQGDNGAFAGAASGSTFIEISSISPRTSRALCTAAQERNCTLLDAPVSGSTPQAEQGQLVLFVGGDEATYQRCKPIFDVIGKAAHYMGPSGMGSAMKLVVNALLGLEMQAIAEAIALGQASGIAKQTLLDVLGQTTLIAPAHMAKLQNARNDEYPSTFALHLMHKDFGLILDEAAHLTVPLPATAAAAQMCSAELGMTDSDKSEPDYSAVIQLMQRLAGQKE